MRYNAHIGKQNARCDTCEIKIATNVRYSQLVNIKACENLGINFRLPLKTFEKQNKALNYDGGHCIKNHAVDAQPLLLNSIQNYIVTLLMLLCMFHCISECTC